MIGAGWILSAIWFIVEWPRPYSKGMWWRQWGWWLIVFLSVWLWACDDRTITETEYVDRDVIVTEPYYTRTVYDENMGEFTAEQQDELLTKGYITMRLFYSPRNAGQIWVQSGTLISSATWQKVTYGDKFVGVALFGKIGYSTDGDTWTQAATPSFGSDTVAAMCYDGTYYLGVGTSGKIGYSTDGDTWTQAGSVASSVTLFSVANGNGVYVAGGESGVMLISTDRDTWSVVASVFGTSRINDIRFLSGRFFGVSDDGKIGFSTDGYNWFLAQTPSFGTSDVYGLCYGLGKMVAVGANSKIAFSID